jgi:hypothetical protein
MISHILPRFTFVMAALAAAAAPLAHTPTRPTPSSSEAFPGWPQTYEGRPLTMLPLSLREASFVRDFPGRIARFSDGSREIIVRYVTVPTRRLHPAADCLKGVGYTITPRPVRRDATGAPMSCIRAAQKDHALDVCEIIHSAQVGQDGEHWPDVSAWYWNTLASGTTGPWWSFVVAEGVP